MKYTALDSTSLDNLQALIAKHPFLNLVSSKEALPDSLGVGLPLIQVETPKCSALISLQGAHLLQFKTAQGNPLLWVSPNCDFTPGVALRGGVPLCLPWFGPAADNPKKPKHGFARNQFWQLSYVQPVSDGAVELTFLLMHSADERFGYDFSAELRMTLGDSVKLELTVNNTSFTAFDCSFAFHNYFPVAQLNGVTVPELTGRIYKDNFDNHREYTQTTSIDFTSPVDRVFPAIDSSLSITGQYPARIAHNNCPSVITWNPGSEAAGAIADIGLGQEKYFVCVERGAVLDEKWSIPAGGKQTAWIEFSDFSAA